MREVRHHLIEARGTVQALPAQQIRIMADTAVTGSAPYPYFVRNGTDDKIIQFMTQDNPGGMTIEALLAVALDRLECFQEGEYPCAENEQVIGLLRKALGVLHDRTTRRIRQGIQGKHMEKTAEKKARVRVEGDKLAIEDGPAGATLPLEPLRTTWKAWDGATRALKLLDPPPTPEEMAVVEGIPTTQAARNGLAELKSALASNVRVRRPAPAEGGEGDVPHSER